MSETQQARLFQRDYRCAFCDADVDRWDRTPQGRRVCPDCGRIPSAEQREAREVVPL
jgi:DNA-directed RNA polymerase subunit RPC12/RpoP